MGCHQGQDPLRTPKGGWFETLFDIDLSQCADADEAVALACREARERRLGVQGIWEGHRLFAYPHQPDDAVMRTFLGLRGAAAKTPFHTLTIDGKPHKVSHPVWARMQLLEQINERLISRLAAHERHGPAAA